MLFFTGRSRDSAQILGEQKRSSERNRAGVIEALHVIKSMAIALRNDLIRGEIDSLGDYLHQSWLAKRQLASGITDPWIDQWYQVARDAGARGGKIAGAGGGGFLLLYSERQYQDQVTEALRAQGLNRMDFRFESGGAMVIVNTLLRKARFAAVFRASTYGLLAITVITFVLRWPLSRAWTVASWALMTGLVIAARFLVRRIAAAVRQRGRLTERVVVVGADEDSIALAEQVNQPGSGMRVVGILDDYIPTGTELPGGLRVVGPSASLLQSTSRLHVQDAIVAPHALPWETLRDLMLVSATRGNWLRVHLSAVFYDLRTPGLRFRERSHVPLLTRG